MLPEISPAIIGGLVGALVTMTGWFVTDFQRRKDAKRTRLADYTQRQIYELYAPLQMLAEKEYSYRKVRKDACDAVEKERRDLAWRLCSERYIFPAQRAIYELLQDKWYLLVDGDQPESFAAVLDHCSRALVLYELDMGGLGNLGKIPAKPMPDKFKDDVEQILRELRSKYNRLLGIRK